MHTPRPPLRLTTQWSGRPTAQALYPSLAQYLCAAAHWERQAGAARALAIRRDCRAHTPRVASPQGGLHRDPTVRAVLATVGADAKATLAKLAATGEPEEQLRAPLERLLMSLAERCGLPPHAVAAVGESSVRELKTRPDDAITVRNALVGFLEVKAPGTGAEPRRFNGRHDTAPWEKLPSRPKLIDTDGHACSLWHSGQVAGSLRRLTGAIETAGADHDAPPGLLSLFEDLRRSLPA